jgi:ubiquinone/menaquinone biosynthesis C-methylase UbiE
MNHKNAIQEYAEQQYSTPSFLIDRLNLWSYGSNPVPLQKWIFSKLQLQGNKRILELGCGTGQLWFENQNEIPPTCTFILSDFSQEMVESAKKNLKSLTFSKKFEIIDAAESIPYEDQTFDLVLGCHMLYHVPNIQQTLESIHRVLKSGGFFITTTVSQRHIFELTEFLLQFNLQDKKNIFSDFHNENGLEVLQPYFAEIEFYEYINNVIIRSINPLMRYISSMYPQETYPDFEQKKGDIRKAIQDILNQKSVFHISGITGLFKARKA